MRNSYHLYAPGDQFQIDIKYLSAGGEQASESKVVNVADVRGGGFFGKVLILRGEGFVIKTTQPDPWQHFWRIVNWDFKPFPAQQDELSAQIEHLSTQIIHLTLPIVSGGKFYSPRSIGYTLLANGFAQVIEKMSGRGPRFDKAGNEYELFRQAQSELATIALSLGLEAVGQIHPDNPFSMANLWLDESRNRFVWLDTNAAIRHTGWVKPIFYFKFHKRIRNEFGGKELTFNKIHADRFRATLKRKQGEFDEKIYAMIMNYLDLYERLWNRRKVRHENQSFDVENVFLVLRQLALNIVPGIVHALRKTLMCPMQLVFKSRFGHQLRLQSALQALQCGLLSQDEYCQAIDGDRTLLRHCVIRKFIRDLSKISPAGGVGSQLDAQLWLKLGSRIEKILESRQCA